MKKQFCPNCYSYEFKEIKENKSLKVRDEVIEYEDLFNVCLDCNEEFDSINNQDVLNDIVYPKFRKLKNMMSPEIFKYLKSKKMLSNVDIAKEINEPIESLELFERGCLQEEELDKKIKILLGENNGNV